MTDGMTMKIARNIAEEQLLAIESGDDCFVLTSDGYRITDEGLWRLESIVIAKIQPIKDALQSLYDEQEGPPSHSREQQWQSAMCKAQRALDSLENKIES